MLLRSLPVNSAFGSLVVELDFVVEIFLPFLPMLNLLPFLSHLYDFAGGTYSGNSRFTFSAFTGPIASPIRKSLHLPFSPVVDDYFGFMVFVHSY